jgi:hypothetical protein
MTAASILADLCRQGAFVSTSGHRLRVEAPEVSLLLLSAKRSRRISGRLCTS